MRRETVIQLLGLLLVAVTAWVNIGVIALDDYYETIAHVIPAGVESSAEIIRGAGFRSPVPPLFLSLFPRALSWIGVENAVLQLRGMLLFLGVSSYLLLLLAARWIFSGKEREWAYALIAFYFVLPLFMTRAMIESLSLPYLTLSAALAQRYVRTERVADLVGAVGALALAAVFRFQSGVCALALPVLVILRRRYTHLWFLMGAGALCFIAAGLLDWALRGEFHRSLREYVSYNLAHSASYGTSPFYTYLLLFAGLAFPPVFWMRYRNLSRFAEFPALLLYFGIFVGAHSLIGHKEERFMVPVLAVFLFLLLPLYAELGPVRRRLFWTINLILLLPVSFNVAQANSVELGRYLSQHPEIRAVYSVSDSLVLHPTAYAGRPVQWREWQPGQAVDCSSAVARRAPLVEPSLDTAAWEKVGSFSPGPLERLFIRLNPRQNQRRGAIELFVRSGCAPRN